MSYVGIGREGKKGKEEDRKKRKERKGEKGGVQFLLVFQHSSKESPSPEGGWSALQGRVLLLWLPLSKGHSMAMEFNLNSRAGS